MKNNIKNAVLSTVLCATLVVASAQTATKPLAAVLGIDSKGVIHNSEAVEYMVRLELEKLNVYSVMDKYDVEEAVKKNGIDANSCFGKSCVVSVGKLLNADKMITGTVDRFGEKIIISLKVIDVNTGEVEKQNAAEYLNLQQEMQKMIGISVQKMLGITPDQNLVNLLINYDAPVESPVTQLCLKGPRMGASMVTGDAAKVVVAPESEGGYNMFPVMFDFGWQHEWQYLSAGNFQAVVEFLPMISGLESGKFIPSITFMNGFRMGKSGWEFAFGPSFRIAKKAEGFFGTGEYGTEKGKWYLRNDWGPMVYADPSLPLQNPFPIVKRMDSRGIPTFSTGLIFGVGRTFRSGYLNIPVNLFVMPRKEGTALGFSFGFNITKKAKTE